MVLLRRLDRGGFLVQIGQAVPVRIKRVERVVRQNGCHVGKLRQAAHPPDDLARCHPESGPCFFAPAPSFPLRCRARPGRQRPPDFPKQSLDCSGEAASPRLLRRSDCGDRRGADRMILFALPRIGFGLGGRNGFHQGDHRSKPSRYRFRSSSRLCSCSCSPFRARAWSAS